MNIKVNYWFVDPQVSQAIEEHVETWTDAIRIQHGEDNNEFTHIRSVNE